MEKSEQVAETISISTGTFKSKIRRSMSRIAPRLFYIMQYSRSGRRIKSSVARSKLFSDFLAQTSGPCLQISVKDEIGEKFGENWTSVDKFDHSDVIDRHDDIQDLDFPDSSFNAIVCWSVLEHIQEPHKAINEMRRVLKPGGLIWVQLPFLFPYHAAPHDYWRVTPNGLRLWMRDFDEIHCACDFFVRTRIVASSFFYGRKPEA